MTILQRARLFHFMPHKVEKTESDNRRQSMSKGRKERISFSLLFLRSDCCDFVSILELYVIFYTLCPIMTESDN